MSPKKRRDSLGRFVSDGQDSDSEQVEVPKVRFWGKMRAVIVLTMMLVLGLPWTVIFFQPAKDYGNHMFDLMGNVTNQLKENMCSCPAKAGRTETSF
jgi:hypothetical protein